MNHEKNQIVIYWDASAILSTLIKDTHSEEAQEWAHKEGAHLLSSVAYTEVLAVLSRMKRERMMADLLAEAALQTLESGPWRRLNSGPEWNLMAALSKKWPLRGTDLWHLSAAKSVCEQLPEVRVLTFDAKLKAAAHGEGMGL
jgi:predicted nucleic acid-binding protein